jgi:hypothetical protein
MNDPFWRAFLGHGAGSAGPATYRRSPGRAKDAGKKILSRGEAGEDRCAVGAEKSSAKFQFTVTDTAADGIPFAITTSVLAPVSAPLGTSKFVETVALPVATPIVLWSWVRA